MNVINTVPGIAPATATAVAHVNACTAEMHIHHLVFSKYSRTPLNVPGFKIFLHLMFSFNYPKAISSLLNYFNCRFSSV
jgi:hypothetical protein